MTLRDVVIAMEAAADAQPSVNLIVPNDVRTLNTIKDARYGVFAWTQANHRADIENGVFSFAFNLFYIDRLADGEGNRLMVQSEGVQTISNILRQMEEDGIPVAGEVTFTPFDYRFTDACTGVYASVTFEVEMETICVNEY